MFFYRNAKFFLNHDDTSYTKKGPPRVTSKAFGYLRLPITGVWIRISFYRTTRTDFTTPFLAERSK